MRLRSRASAIFGISLWIALSAGSVAAEIRRVEGIGAAPAAGESEAGRAPREAALEAAIRDGVLRVLETLLAGEAVDSREIEQKIGAKASDYAVRYRLLSDRGERPALLLADPNVTREYVVEAEVHVDVGRLQEELEAAGLLAPKPVQATGFYAVTIAGPVDFQTYDALLAVLGKDRDVRSAEPVLLSRSEVRLEVKSVVPPTQLARGLPSELALRGVAVVSATSDSEGLHLTLQNAPELLSDGPASGD